MGELKKAGRRRRENDHGGSVLEFGGGSGGRPAHQDCLSPSLSLSLSRFFSLAFSSLSLASLCQFYFDDRLRELDADNNIIIHILDFFSTFLNNFFFK